MTSRETALDRGILQAIAAFRWLSWGWAFVGALIARQMLVRPFFAFALLGAALVVSLLATDLVRRRPAMLLSRPMILAELAIGGALLIGDGLVYEVGREQSLPWAWPAAGIMAAAVAFGPIVGLVAALVMAAASFVGESLLDGAGDWSLGEASKSALYALAALAAGYASRRLREAEEEISIVRAREEMARTLHDGVLQTLAVVQRRSTAPELRELAADQERDLRAFLFGEKPDRPSLEAALRGVAELVARRYGVHSQVVVADDLPVLSDDAADAVTGAVAEALTNAAKHSGSDQIVVYAEPDFDGSGVFCSVKDRGTGFDPATIERGEGLTRSIEARVAEAGGRVEIVSRPERGTEVKLWVG